MIATITRHQIGTVERALQIFLKLGLVEMLDGGAFYMSNIELLIGQSSTEGERKRQARMALQRQGGQMSATCPPEIELEKEIELERKREGETGQATVHAYGRYANVFLTEVEIAEIQTDYPAAWDGYIEKLSVYMESTGKKYNSHAATIRRWAAEDTRKSAPLTRDRDYSTQEDETV